MRFLSNVTFRAAVSLAAVLVVSACSDGRQTPLSGVEVTDTLVADTGPQANVNINNPTLEMPETFQVSDGDLLTLVWSDEFDGANLDPEVWFFATGDGAEAGLPGGWGNNELQHYLPDNAMLVNGVLEITARRETVGNLDYTSARINTEDRFAFRYGRIEASIKLPAGQGIWPAFWMLSQDSEYQCDGSPCDWAATGEIDVMEAVNLDATGGNEIYGTLHYGGEFPANTSSGSTFTPSADVTDDFHTYALEWDEFEMRWYFDGQLYAVQNAWFSSAAPYPAPFDQPFNILLNVAVGGSFPGSPNATTPFPVTMEVDWVRVYSGEEAPTEPADPGTIPDDVIYASNPNEMVDIVFGVDYSGFDPFGSGSAFDNNVTSDSDFSPAFGVTTGDGYGAQVGQFAIVGFAPGFASSYATLDFKAKGLNNDLIRIKFLDDPDYLDITLTSSPYSTALGNGWYQVSIPLTDATGVAAATGLLFETDGTSPSAFTFLLTDIGFSGTTGGGGGGGGGNIAVNGGFETGDFSGWETTPGGGTQAVTNVNPSEGTFAANLTVPVRTASDPGIDNLIKNANLEAGNLTGDDTVTVSFDMRGSLSGAGGVVFAELFSELSGGGTSKAEILSGAPLSPSANWTPFSFTTTLGPDVSGGVSLQLKASCGAVEGCGVDVFFDNISIVTGTGGGGGGGGGTSGIIPDDVIYASDPNEMVDIVFGVDYSGFEPFGSGSAFDNNVTTDADFNPAFGVTTGNGYGAQVGQFALVGFAPGFASGYATLDFKAKGVNNDLIRIKFLDDPDYLDMTLTSSTYSTDLGNGWYQVSIPLTDTTGVAAATGLLFETDGLAANAFTFLLTDIGFSGTAGGGGGGTLLATFDEVTPPVVTPFGGAVTVIEAAPAGGDGTNALNITRNGGEVFAGAWIAIAAIPSDAGTQTVSAQVFSPTAGIPIVSKAEYGENQGTGDVQANEAAVVGWQTLTWTYTNLDPAQVYNRFTMLPNLGAVDTATSYFFDNITLLEGSGGGGGTGGGDPASGDIAVNGGFESGDFSGWEVFPNGGIQTITSTSPSEGTFAANLTVPVRGAGDPAVDNLIKNANLEAGNLTPGATVTVNFDMRGSLTGAGGVVFAEFFSELTGGGTSKAEIFSGGPLTPNVNWTPYSFTTTLGPDVSGGATLQLKSSCGPVEGCGVDVFFDNVSIMLQ